MQNDAETAHGGDTLALQEFRLTLQEGVRRANNQLPIRQNAIFHTQHRSMRNTMPASYLQKQAHQSGTNGSPKGRLLPCKRRPLATLKTAFSIGEDGLSWCGKRRFVARIVVKRSTLRPFAHFKRRFTAPARAISEKHIVKLSETACNIMAEKGCLF